MVKVLRSQPLNIRFWFQTETRMFQGWAGPEDGLTFDNYSQNLLSAWHWFLGNPMHLYNYATVICVTICHVLWPTQKHDSWTTSPTLLCWALWISSHATSSYASASILAVWMQRSPCDKSAIQSLAIDAKISLIPISSSSSSSWFWCWVRGL